MCVQSIEGLDDSGIATSQPQGVRFVDLEKARNQSAFLLEISAHGDQRALHQLRHAVANHAPDLVGLDRAQAGSVQSHIERRTQIFRAVDKRTVKIANYRLHRIQLPHAYHDKAAIVSLNRINCTEM